MKIQLTETTLKELLSEVRNAKINPESSPGIFFNALRPAGEIPDTIEMSSEFSDVSFEIHIEKEPQTQESLGYKIK